MEEVKKDVQETKQPTSEDITMKALSILDSIYGGKTPDVKDIVGDTKVEETKVESKEETVVEEETKVDETKVEETKVDDTKKVVEEEKQETKVEDKKQDLDVASIMETTLKEMSASYQSIIDDLKEQVKALQDTAPFGLQGRTAKIEQGDPTDVKVDDIYKLNNFGNKF